MTIFTTFSQMLRHHWTVPSCLQVICTSVTLVLIIQELIIFTVVRPTSTSTEEVQLDKDTFPDVTICRDPAFSHQGMEKHGYNGFYYRGSMDRDLGHKFVGWNGKSNAHNSSEILEDVLMVKQDQRLIEADIYLYNNVTPFKANITNTLPIFPKGRCQLIKPPVGINPNKILYLHLYFSKKTSLATSTEEAMLTVYFRDPVNSVWNSDFGMKGVPINIPLDTATTSHHYQTVFKINILQTVHVEGDPVLQCKTYTVDNSYNDCVQEELFEQFDKRFKCIPPLYAVNNEQMCNKEFNMTDYGDEEIKSFFWQLADQYTPNTCKPP